MPYGDLLYVCASLEGGDINVVLSADGHCENSRGATAHTAGAARASRRVFLRVKRRQNKILHIFSWLWLGHTYTCGLCIGDFVLFVVKNAKSVFFLTQCLY